MAELKIMIPHEKMEAFCRMGYYEAGHMTYIHMPSLKKMKADLAELIKNSENV
jgi:carboxypeptidase C (cathepsin A)